MKLGGWIARPVAFPLKECSNGAFDVSYTESRLSRELERSAVS